MHLIENPAIRREAKSLQLIHKFSDYDFTEIAGKFQFEGGQTKEDAEKLAIQQIRKRYK